MHQPRIPNYAILALLATALVLPITICVVLGVAALLQTMGDASGGYALNRIALVGGVLWAVDLICLVLLLAIGSLHGPEL